MTGKEYIYFFIERTEGIKPGLQYTVHTVHSGGKKRVGLVIGMEEKIGVISSHVRDLLRCF